MSAEPRRAAVITVVLGVVIGFIGLLAPGRSLAAANPLAGWRWYVAPHSAAARSAQHDPTHARMFDKIASTAHAIWLTGGTATHVRDDVHRVVTAASAVHALPVLVAYDIPRRDCGSYSSGGATSASAYRSWIAALAAGIGRGAAVVVVEPDALAELSCLTGAQAAARESLLRYALSTLRTHPHVVSYLDAGHSGWVDPHVMARRLLAAGLRTARGFSLNVSNFDATATEIGYGDRISAAAGSGHFVIDTGRNGRGPAAGGAWCNPPGRGLGTRPTTRTPDPARLDALLWVKPPGESDGSCGPGQPAAGEWWPSYALGLAERASW